MAIFLVNASASKPVKIGSGEASNLQIQVNAPDGRGFVHSAVPISVRALGARTSGGKSVPTISDDVIVPYNDPDFE
uniref:Uncharacterized protein n=1 Tax=Caenorhabditis japonica TaxID=281687 RepID=A0A8R1IF91_CAEJA